MTDHRWHLAGMTPRGARAFAVAALLVKVLLLLPAPDAQTPATDRDRAVVPVTAGAPWLARTFDLA